MKVKYNKDYYENGLAKGISGYENYRWIPELTYPMAYSICKSLKIRTKNKTTDNSNKLLLLHLLLRITTEKLQTVFFM